MSLLSQYIPDPAVEDIVARRVRITLGEQDFVLPVLSIERNEGWREAVNAAAPLVLEALDDEANLVAIVGYFSAQAEQLYGLLRTYDEMGLGYLGRSQCVLPDWEAVRSLGSEEDVITAFLGVLKRAYPLAVVVLTIASDVDALTKIASAATATVPTPSGPTKPARPSTAGRRRRSVSS